MTFQFETYKSDMGRKIFLKSIVNGNGLPSFSALIENYKTPGRNFFPLAKFVPYVIIVHAKTDKEEDHDAEEQFDDFMLY